MSAIIVVATALEVAPTLERYGITEKPGIGTVTQVTPGLELLVTGVGQALTAFHLGSLLARNRFDLLINVGIAGSFAPQLEKGAVVRVVAEAFADLGIEERERNIDLFDAGLLNESEYPFVERVLHAPEIPLPDDLAILPEARAVTVNRVLGRGSSIADIVQRYRPEIVNMEGAAVFYAALFTGTPFVSLRSVSDSVGPRDKSSWDISLAVERLNDMLLSFLGSRLGHSH